MCGPCAPLIINDLSMDLQHSGCHPKKNDYLCMANPLQRYFIYAMKRPSVFISLFALLLFAVGVGVWQYLSPPVHDDIYYMHFCLPTTENDFWELEGSPVTSFSQAADSAWNHWQLVNGRLTNILATFLLISPPWLLASLQAMMALLMMSMILFFGLGRKALNVSWICSLLLLISWKLLPWHNNMNSDDYMINYVWPSALVLCFLALVFHPEFLNSRLRQWLWALPAFFIGMLHEGFSIPVLGSLCLLFVFPKFLPRTASWPDDWRKRLLVPVMAFAAGACVCIFAPSTIARLLRQSDEVADTSCLGLAVAHIFHTVPLFLYLAILALALWRQGFAGVWKLIKGQAFWLTMFILSFAIAVVLRHPAARMLWFADVIMIILSLQLIRTLGASWLRPRKGLAVAAIAVQALFLGNIFTIQSKLGQELSLAFVNFWHRADGMVFVDYTHQGDIPWWTFGLIDSYVNSCLFNIQAVKSLPQFKGISNAVALVLPDSLSYVKSYADIPPIPGDNPFRGVYPVVLTDRYIEPGTSIDVKFGEAGVFINPLRRRLLVPGPGRLSIDKIMLVPKFLPDTVYSIFFNGTLTRDVESITWQPSPR